MKHLFSFARLVVFLMIVGVLVVGCNSGESNPVASDIGAETAANLTGPVNFKVILPESAGRAATTVPLMSSIRAVDVTAPTVTFKLILVNTGNSGAPTSTMVKTAAVSEAGAAETTFTSVPVGACVGDIHIDGGNIDSYSDFHGAIDLVAGVANTLYVTPKGSKLQPDFVAYVIEQIVATPVLFGKALPGLTAQVIQAIAGLDKSKSTAYSDAIAMFAKYVNLTIQVSTTAKTITYNGNGNDAGLVPVDTNSYGAGEVVTLAFNTGSLSKTGYIFYGWNTQADGLGTTYSPGSTLQLGNENVNLFAKWGSGATL
ncbi:MAG: InlB B-repeat-containing protein, partial [Candidatus Riflebacteria bacterium]|nr:InlB B-repeat-containing protein [Candidatus Riflebacteria bacterium]